MATYQYAAVDKFGKEKKGSIDARTLSVTGVVAA